MLGLGLGIASSTFKGALSAIKVIVNAFKARVLSDGGTFEGEANLLAQNADNINSASFVYIPSSYKAGVDYCIKGTDLTHARNSVAYRNNANNVLEQMAANVGRVSYINGVPTLLIEPLRTNLMEWSEDFSQAVWSKTGGAVITSNTIVAPNGNQTADVITGGAVFQNKTVVNGSVYRGSVWIKASTNGTAVIGNAAGAVFLGINITTQWQRFTFSRTTTGTSDGLAIFANQGLTTLHVWGAQYELGTTVTSYIPTTSSSVTRVADVASITRSFTANSTIFQNVFLNTGSLADSNAYTLLDIRVSTSVRITLYRINNGLSIDVINSSVQYSGSVYTLPTLVQNTLYKIAIVTTATNFKVFVNGLLVFTSGTLSMPNLSSAPFAIGSFTTGVLQWNGSIINTFIEDTNLSDSECITRTT
jgi:hypothetical protein